MYITNRDRSSLVKIFSYLDVFLPIILDPSSRKDDVLLYTDKHLLLEDKSYYLIAKARNFPNELTDTDMSFLSKIIDNERMFTGFQTVIKVWLAELVGFNVPLMKEDIFVWMCKDDMEDPLYLNKKFNLFVMTEMLKDIKDLEFKNKLIKEMNEFEKKLGSIPTSLYRCFSTDGIMVKNEVHFHFLRPILPIERKIDLTAISGR